MQKANKDILVEKQRMKTSLMCQYLQYHLRKVLNSSELLGPFCTVKMLICLY